MKELVAQHALLQQQLSNVYSMITTSLNPFRIDDCNYAKGDITLRIYWGFEEEWQVITDKGYISGHSNYGDVEIWNTVWHVLHGLPVVYDHDQNECAQGQDLLDQAQAFEDQERDCDNNGGNCDDWMIESSCDQYHD